MKITEIKFDSVNNNKYEMKYNTRNGKKKINVMTDLINPCSLFGGHLFSLDNSGNYSVPIDTFLSIEQIITATFKQIK